MQAQLKPDRVEKLKQAVPDLSDEDVKVMQRVPFRSFSPSIVDEPTVYRFREVSSTLSLLLILVLYPTVIATFSTLFAAALVSELMTKAR